MNHLYPDERLTSVTRQAVTLIYNPVAGWRRRRKLIEVVEAMNHRGAVVTLRETTGPGDAEVFAREAAREGKADIVVAAGGDGTINEVANGLAGTEVPLGVIPIGTANVLAIEIGLPHSSDALGALLLEGAARPIGAGRVNKRFFLLWVGAGFDGRLVHQIDPGFKRRYGKLAFVLAGLRLILAGKPAQIVVSDGRTSVTCGWAVTANAVHYAGKFRLAPSTRFDEVGLKTLAVPARGRLSLIVALAALGLGRLEKLKGVQVLEAAHITMTDGSATGEPEPVQVDGDDMLTLPAEIECWDPLKAPQIRLVMP